MRISDWSSDVCSSDLAPDPEVVAAIFAEQRVVEIARVVTLERDEADRQLVGDDRYVDHRLGRIARFAGALGRRQIPLEPDIEPRGVGLVHHIVDRAAERSEEHTSELQSLMRISYAVFCLKKKKLNNQIHKHT